MNYRDNTFIPSVKPDLKPNRDRQPSNGTDKSAREHAPYMNVSRSSVDGCVNLADWDLFDYNYETGERESLAFVHRHRHTVGCTQARCPH